MGRPCMIILQARFLFARSDLDMWLTLGALYHAPQTVSEQLVWCTSTHCPAGEINVIGVGLVWRLFWPDWLGHNDPHVRIEGFIHTMHDKKMIIGIHFNYQWREQWTWYITRELMGPGTLWKPVGFKSFICIHKNIKFTLSHSIKMQYGCLYLNIVHLKHI